MAEISGSSWSETDALNSSPAPNGFPEGMPFSGVNDSARAVMGAVKRFWGRINGRYASTGSSNAYVLTPDVALSAYVTGERYSFRANFANTGAATLNISSLGAKSIKKMTASGKADLAPGDIQQGQPVTVEYDGTDFVMVTPVAPRTIAAGAGLAGGGDLSADRTIALDPSYLRGYIAGLTLSNNASDPNNDIDIALGVAVDSTGAKFIKLTSTLTKRLDAQWSQGSNAGGLDSGTKQANTTYHVHLICAPDGTVDAMFSTSLTPTLPAPYTHYRRIGSVITDGSGNIRQFKQLGDEFRLVTAVNDVSVSNLGATATLYTLTVPTGVQVEALFRAWMAHASPGTGVIFTAPDEADQAPTGGGHADIQSITTAPAALYGNFRRRTNTSSQIRARSSASSTGIGIYTYGWIDTRGRFD